MTTSLDDKKIKLYKFQSILDFVTELYESVGKTCKPLTMYYRLITKTHVNEQELLERHIKCFTKFCKNNREAIEEHDPLKIKTSCIEFTDRIYIDVPFLIKKLTDKDKEAVWKHLEAISAMLKDNVDTDALTRLMDTPLPNDDTVQRIMGIFQEEMEAENIEMSDNPMELIMRLMSSGVINKIVTRFKSELDSGEMDFKDILKASQSMTESLGEDAQFESNPMIQELIKSMGSMMQNFPQK